jgi:predicted RNA-binding protein YlxR (DUF448 family)
MSTPHPTTRKRKGPRPKHVPQRTCVACREHAAKRTLFRIVRTPEGQVEIDPTGKMNGRGAYLCDQRGCWDRAVTTNVWARALNTELTHETLETLRRFAASLPDTEPAEHAASVRSTDHA